MAKIVQFAQNALSGRVAGRSSASDTETRILGMKELLAGLEKMPEELGKKAIWSALNGAAGIVRRRAVELAPELDSGDPAVLRGYRKPGTIKRAIRASKSRTTRGQNGMWEVIVRVKPLKSGAKSKFKKASGLAGAKNPDDPYYWWWVEFGTSKMAARPFLRPAFNETRDAQLEALRRRMSASIARYAKQVDQETKRAA